jgi:hypothetical protein
MVLKFYRYIRGQRIACAQSKVALPFEDLIDLFVILPRKTHIGF